VEQGKRYLVITQIKGMQGYPRYSIMDYLWENEREVTFSARPVAGTQAIDRRNFISAREVPKSTKIVLNKDARTLKV
jgi:hypothetical protein